MNDPETDAIVMIGEIGGGMEAEAARWIRDNTEIKSRWSALLPVKLHLPVAAVGHAGAIVGGAERHCGC